MTQEILNAIEQGKPFWFDNHTLKAVPFDNTLHDMCSFCKMDSQCTENVACLCEEIQDEFIDSFYLKILDR